MALIFSPAHSEGHRVGEHCYNLVLTWMAMAPLVPFQVPEPSGAPTRAQDGPGSPEPTLRVLQGC